MMRTSTAWRSAAKGIRARLHTIYSPTPAALSSYLDSLPRSADSASLYLLSATPSADLGALVSTLQKALPQSVGSFCTPVPSGNGARSEPTLSIATFANARIWRSEITGRRPVEVGRWYRPREMTSEDAKGTEAGDLASLSKDDWWEPEVDIRRVPELEGVSPKGLIVLSDGAPRPVLRALDGMFPSVAKVGLVSAATPFLTGREHTMIYGSSFYETGSVGLALHDEIKPEVDFNLEPMTEATAIETSRGNMLLTFEGGANPTQSLITAIQRRGGQGLSKEEDFYLGLLDNGKIKEAVRILSGDPSRGALSLDTEDQLVSGQIVQFLQKKKGSALPNVSSSRFTFGALSKTQTIEDAEIGSPRAEDGFLGLSEAGLVYSLGKTSVCTAPGASVSFGI